MGKTLIALPFVTQGRERAVAWTCSKSCGWFLGGVMMIVGRGCWTCPNPFEEYSSCHNAWFGLISSDVGCDSCILTKVVFSSPKSLNFGIIAHFVVI